mgnify:FL=1
MGGEKAPPPGRIGKCRGAAPNPYGALVNQREVLTATVCSNV